MDFELELVEPQEIVLHLDNMTYLGVDPKDADALEKDVLLNKTFYAQSNEKKIGTLIAYDVQEQDLGDGKSRLVITRLTSEDTPEKDAEIIEQNIMQMQTADIVEINKNGGTLAADEEYSVAENEFQKLARIIMGVVRI